MNLKNDNSIAVATGRSRKETHWRNQEIMWSQLVEKLSKTHHTPETLVEYLKADKTRQDEIKDIGGFVGGSLAGGRRKADTVVSRSILTLDADSTDIGLWDDYCMLYSYAACVYSTHKHSPEKPRLRLVICLDRAVTPTEYEAIARRVAGSLKIDRFDDTTYEPSRLMYWPSTPKDVDYYFHYIDAPMLPADEILSSYRDWRDASEWPVSDRQGEAVRREMKKQADPLEKPGLIGAFCRTYTITQVLDIYLKDIYQPCDIRDRYTYVNGSTAAGLIVYDDKYAYSHHGTDPTGGMLCNAFDLVRIHLYGLRDENTKNDTPINRRPSFLAMEDMVSADVEVKRTIAVERLADAGEDFAGIVVEDESEWLEKMDTDKKGHYLSTENNFKLVIENEPMLRVALARDTFNHMDVVLSDLPWRKVRDKNDRFWRNADDACLRSYLGRAPWGMSSKQKIEDALETVLEAKRFHPIRDYLNALTWDGVERLDTLFIDYLGAPDNTLTRAMTRKAFTAAVARVMAPGTKFDYTVVLIGDQGIGKSTILKKMGGEWFSDSFLSVEGKEAMEQLHGAWIMEIGELAGLKKAEVEAIKVYLSKSTDKFRVAYGRRNEAFPRQTVFFATTNEENFLRDATGNRRFWPITTDMTAASSNVHDDLTEDVRGQLWAEAYQRYRDHEPLYLPEDMEKEARALQQDHAEIDERKGIIEEFLNIPLPTNWHALNMEERRMYFVQRDALSPVGASKRDRICAVEILWECFGERLDEKTRYRTREINGILKTLPGWEPKNPTEMWPYGNQRYFKKKAINSPIF